MSVVEGLLQAIAALDLEEQIRLAGRLLARLQEEGHWPPSGKAGGGLVHPTPEGAVQPAFDIPPPQGSLEGPADLLLLFDGGSMGNPGPGYGSFLLQWADGSNQILRRLDFGEEMTSNEAEYETLIAALQEIGHLLGENAAGISLEIRGDSKLVANQVLGRWKTKEPRMRVLRSRAWEQLRRFEGRWRFEQVPREEVARLLGH